MTTITVDISEADLPNFIALDRLNLHSFGEEGVKKLLIEFPFALYKQRMFGDHMLTIQISLDNYILFRVHSIIK